MSSNARHKARSSAGKKKVEQFKPSKMAKPNKFEQQHNSKQSMIIEQANENTKPQEQTNKIVPKYWEDMTPAERRELLRVGVKSTMKYEVHDMHTAVKQFLDLKIEVSLPQKVAKYWEDMTPAERRELLRVGVKSTMKYEVHDMHTAVKQFMQM